MDCQALARGVPQKLHSLSSIPSCHLPLQRRGQSSLKTQFLAKGSREPQVQQALQFWDSQPLLFSIPSATSQAAE